MTINLLQAVEEVCARTNKYLDDYYANGINFIRLTLVVILVDVNPACQFLLENTYVKCLIKYFTSHIQCDMVVYLVHVNVVIGWLDRDAYIFIIGK